MGTGALMNKITLDIDRIVGAAPSYATELHNMCKCTEELGELAECIFKKLPPENRVEEIADVLISASMDMKWCGVSTEQLSEAIERKLSRQEKRRSNEKQQM